MTKLNTIWDAALSVKALLQSLRNQLAIAKMNAKKCLYLHKKYGGTNFGRFWSRNMQDCKILKAKIQSFTKHLTKLEGAL